MGPRIASATHGRSRGGTHLADLPPNVVAGRFQPAVRPVGGELCRTSSLEHRRCARRSTVGKREEHAGSPYGATVRVACACRREHAVGDRGIGRHLRGRATRHRRDGGRIPFAFHRGRAGSVRGDLRLCRPLSSILGLIRRSLPSGCLAERACRPEAMRGELRPVAPLHTLPERHRRPPDPGSLQRGNGAAKLRQHLFVLRRHDSAKHLLRVAPGRRCQREPGRHHVPLARRADRQQLCDRAFGGDLRRLGSLEFCALECAFRRQRRRLHRSRGASRRLVRLSVRRNRPHRRHLEQAADAVAGLCRRPHQRPAARAQPDRLHRPVDQPHPELPGYGHAVVPLA